MSCTFISKVSNQYGQHPCETWVRWHSFVQLLLLSRTTDWTGAFARFRWTIFHPANYRLDVFLKLGTPSICMQFVFETQLQNWYLSSIKKQGV